MSHAGEPFDSGPADGSPPDLFAGAPGWEAPVPDLADETVGAGDGRRSAGGAPRSRARVTERDAGGVLAGDPSLEDLSGAPPAGPSENGAGPDDGPALPDLSGDGADGLLLPDLGGDGADDPWAPAPEPVPLEADVGVDAPLSDLTRRPRRGRRAASAAGAMGDDRPRSANGAPDRGGRGRRGPGGTRGTRAADGSDPVRPSGPRAPGPVAEALAAVRGREPDPDDPSTAPAGAVDGPRGLATPGPLGGLEPGTLFGPAAGGEPAAATGRGGRRRRGRGRSGEDAPSDDPGGNPERPLTAEERLQHALKLSYRHLTKRDRTVSEVRAHLEKREVDETSIAGALAELVEFKYLDDERYAARYVEDKRRLEGWGLLRIEQGLRRTGVPREVADRAVAADPQRGDEAELAVEALEQRLNGRAPGDDRGRQKALRLLATKGYPLDTAYAAVRTYERRCAEREEE